jgi:hypothetical protein
MADASSLFSTVKNLTGADHVFGYLGAHGKKLPAGGHYTQFGDIFDTIAPDHISKSTRGATHFQNDLKNGVISLVSTPRTILKDSVDSAVKVLTLSGGALGTADASWGSVVDS